MTEEFKHANLIKIPQDILSYNFLEGDFGKEIIKEYNSIVKSKYKDNSNLNVFNYKDEVVKGSNVYSILVMDDLLSKYGLRTADSADASKIINNNEEFLKGFYVDFGIVLRNEGIANEYFAKELAKQSKKRNYKFSNANPLVFKPSDLEVVLDNNSSFGLGFKIKDLVSPFHAPELSYKNSGKRFKEINSNGVPIFDKNGSKFNYTGQRGLSRFNLCADSNLDSGWSNFESSGIQGRIIVVRNAL
jgi:hypothetical protein